MKLKFLKSRRFKHGSMSTVITVGFIIAVVIINAIASVILQKYPLTIDLTSDNRFGLTEESINYVKEIDKPVSITVCAAEDVFESASEMYKQAYEVINNYAKYNKNITVEYVDLDKNPTFAQQYPEETLNTADIIVKSDLRYKKFPSYELFVESQYESESKIFSNAESTMTSAIMYVLDEEPVKAVSLNGSASTAPAFVELLESNNFEIVEQNLLTDEIDPDAKLAILVAPANDLTADEIDKLDKFLTDSEEFGRTLIYVPKTDAPNLPNLDEFLQEWGLKVNPGIIMETNTQNAVNNVYSVINQFVDETYTEDLRNPSNPFITSYTHPVETLFESSDNRKTTVLAKTADTTLLIPADADENLDLNKLEQQSYNTVVMASRQKYYENKPVSSNVVVYGSELALNQVYLQYSTFNNGDYTANLVSELAGKEESLNIVPVDLTIDTIAITNSQKIIYTVIFSVAIPLVILIAGTVIWLRRRHL